MREERTQIIGLVDRWVQDSIDPHGQLKTDSLENALAMARAAQQVQRAAEEVRQAADAEVERHLGRNYYKSGPHVWAISKSGSWKILDTEKAWRFVTTINDEEGFELARPLLDLATRKTAWEAMAERRGLNPTTVIDTFLERHWSPPSLKPIPLEEAPKYVQICPDGIVEKKQRAKGGDDE